MHGNGESTPVRRNLLRAPIVEEKDQTGSIDLSARRKGARVELQEDIVSIGAFARRNEILIPPCGGAADEGVGGHRQKKRLGFSADRGRPLDPREPFVVIGRLSEGCPLIDRNLECNLDGRRFLCQGGDGKGKRSGEKREDWSVHDHNVEVVEILWRS